jgi:hypothetical protein
LYLKDKDQAFNINHMEKNYSEIRKDGKAQNNPVINVAFTDASETAKILDYNCKKYTRTITVKDKAITQEVWVTKDISDLNLSFLSKQRIGKFYFSLDKLDGVPLKMVARDADGEYVFDAKAITPGKVDDKTFLLPKGYRSLSPSGKTPDEKKAEKKKEKKKATQK